VQLGARLVRVDAGVYVREQDCTTRRDLLAPQKVDNALCKN
jgi:hypothetical protein